MVLVMMGRCKQYAGFDGFQAIELALRLVGYRLTEINARSGGRLRWQFGDNGRLPDEWAQKDAG